jgi:hypothetical protein
MLSAAHVLAMDAKNLLDVVDSIRLRFPSMINIPIEQQQQQQQLVKTIKQSPPSSPPANTNNNSQLKSTNPSTADHQKQQAYTNDNIDCYQNLQHFQHGGDGNGSARLENNDPDGIYDNECIISQHLKQLNNRPQIASKPVNAIHKLRAEFSGGDDGRNNDSLLNESLQIVEDPNELYCNVGKDTNSDNSHHLKHSESATLSSLSSTGSTFEQQQTDSQKVVNNQKNT